MHTLDSVQAVTRPVTPARIASDLLFRGGVFAGAWVTVVVLAAAALLPFGLWRPLIALPLLTVGLVAAGLLARALPDQEAPPWTAVACLAIAAAHGLRAAWTHSEQVLVRRDAGSYALYTQWISSRHGLPVDARLDAFGGPAVLADPGFTLGSPAFYQVIHPAGTAEIVPQFLPGAPAVYSLGEWIGGWPGLFAAPAVIGALAVLAIAGLAARLVGPRWAVPAAAGVALLQPVLHASRGTYSEPVALLLIAAALCLLHDATGTHNRWLGAVAGAGLGFTALVRVDALREVILLLPFAALLAARRHPAAWPGAGSALAAVTIAGLWDVRFSGPYLDSLEASLTPLVLAGAGTAAACLGLVAAVRFGDRTPSAAVRQLAPVVAVAGVSAGLAALAARPLWQVVRQDPNDPGSLYVAAMQAAQGLPVDGGRTYAEHSVQWVQWWTGPVAAAVAAVVLAVLAGRAARELLQHNRTPPWLGPFVVAVTSTVLTLYRPGITPDHPWADRRLVVVVLPTVVIAAVAGVAWAVRRARDRNPGERAAVAVLGVAAVLLPAALVSVPDGGRTERGELDAVRRVCGRLQPHDTVLVVGSRGTEEWPQALRGICAVPAAGVTGEASQLPARLDLAIRRVRATGRRPVVFSATDETTLLAGVGLTPTRVVAITTTEDPTVLTRRPAGTADLPVDAWVAYP